ncbi:MAG: Gfo/Idh/MocA family protein, partial [Planctomycetota bacterium]
MCDQTSITERLARRSNGLYHSAEACSGRTESDTSQRDIRSETFGGVLIGCGGRGNGTFNAMGLEAKKLAICDVKFVGRADNKTVYTDFRRVLERKDIDVVAIATPPHWHALISIAAMEAGKDVLCEKPMTRFIAEGRAVAEAEKRYNRIFQVGTFGRFGRSKDPRSIEIHKIMASGLLRDCQGVH